MRQRTLVIAALAAVGAAIAVAVPIAIIAIQSSHELKFEYVKSGGLGGTNERLVFDSATNVITFEVKPGPITNRQLSNTKVQELRHMIANSGFFTMDSVPPKAGPSDYFAYFLNVTMEGVTHSVSWVEDSASSKQVPESLKNIVNEIEIAYANAS